MAATAVSYTLVGPPEARHAAASATEAAPTGDAFVDLKVLTEKLSPTFVSSGDPCLDFFFNVVPGTPAASVASLLAGAWAADPATALRLVANLRGVRGSGKSDREGFYAAALWLHAHYPTTLALNAASVAAFGYFKDLPELLHRIVHGGVLTRTPGKKVRLAAEDGGFVGRGRPRLPQPHAAPRGPRLARRHDRGARRGQRRARPEALGRGRCVAPEQEGAGRGEGGREVQPRPHVPFPARPHGRPVRRPPRGGHAQARRRQGPGVLARGEVVPLAGQVLRPLHPPLRGLARPLFPRGSSPELAADLPDAQYAYRARECLRRTALVPLRRALKLPEVFISARAWESVVYTRVASVAMKNYKDLFLKRDAERFNAYLADVKSGKKKIAAGALLPHEIISSLGDDGGVADLQWQRMVEDMRVLGKLTNCVAVCDVSGSMSGLPMDVCVALGLLVSELSDDPWRGRVITFSDRPEIHRITGDTLSDKVDFIRVMDWGMNTNFQAVFDKILEVAVGAGLPPERMVRRVFVFSDMEFDQASAQPWETDYEAIVRKFTEAGYGAVVPEVVFWNLRDSKAVPVTYGQKGVALVSGFSKNLLKLFLDGGGIVTPRAVMEKAIAGPEYDKLAVFD